MTLRDQLIRDEGVRYKGYKDSRGKWTIGVGYCVETGPALSHQLVMAILDEQVYGFQQELMRDLPWVRDLNMPRLAVLVNMAFCMGIDGLMGFGKMLRAGEAGDWVTASKELMDSEFASQVGDGPGGKFDRAERLAKQLLTGLWI